MIRASFESPSSWFVKEMKWLMLTSILLIGVSLLCFAYTAKTLLSQYQLTILKDDFINNMTHELNTPIASIQITTDALKSFDYEPQKRREYLDMISYQTKKLAKLSDQVLNSGQTNMIINNEQIEINSLMQNALNDLSPQSQSANANIVFLPFSNQLYLLGTRSLLLNSFINIIENALKYSAQQPSIKINVYANKQFVCVTVADQGIGIQPEYRTKIFEKFFRVPHGNVHDRKGYGLGLSYVKDVIDAHGGKIMTAPNDPQGTVFTVKLPLS